MTTPRISILVPVRNAANTLVEALDSIIGQTFTDWEIIAVDDASTDESQCILKRYTANNPRIVCVCRERCGIVEALSTAAERATGKLLARMDADDISEPTRLETQAAMFDAIPDLALCGARVRMFGGGMGIGRKRYEAWINALVTHTEIERDLFVECPVPHPTFMMRREIFDAAGGYCDFGWPEDYDLVLRLWRQGGIFAKPPGILVHWRHHAKRLSMTDARYGEKAFRAIKRRYLFETVLKDESLPFYQWGAGEVGKKWLREWPVPPRAAVDINPRKIGRKIHGVSVIAPEQLPPPGQCIILIAVGAPGARDEIRDYLSSRHYREPEHFRFIA